MNSKTMALADHITSVLAAAGFRKYDLTKDAWEQEAAFLAHPGDDVGATVGIAWQRVLDEEGAALLAKYQDRLRADGLSVINRDFYLDVDEAGEDPDGGGIVIKQILDDGWLRYFVELCPACQEAITRPGGEEIAARALSAGHCDHEYTGKLVPVR